MLFYPLGAFGLWEIAIILLLFLLLFGGKKIPELMKGLGKGISSFKKGLNEVDEQINQSEPKAGDKNLPDDNKEN